jgi:glycine cleavage system H protein
VEFPANLKYTKEHEWVLVEGGTATIGITDHAQEALGDIVYIGDLAEVGDDVDMDDVIGVIESVKATSDLFSPLAGKIAAVNEDLDDAPETINEKPYGDGWILKIKMSNAGEIDDLMDAEDYQKLISDES